MHVTRKAHMKQRMNVIVLVKMRISTRHNSIAIVRLIDSGTWCICSNYACSFFQIGCHHVSLGKLNFWHYLMMHAFKIFMQLLEVLQFKCLNRRLSIVFDLLFVFDHWVWFLVEVLSLWWLVDTMAIEHFILNLLIHLMIEIFGFNGFRYS